MFVLLLALKGVTQVDPAVFVRKGMSHFAKTLEAISLDETEIIGVTETVLRTELPVLCSGVGKSGFIAAKLAATFNSLGVRASFLNPTDALHGDLGIVETGSVVILISNSGSTSELCNLLPSLHDRSCQIIAIVSNGTSRLAKGATHVLDYGAVIEADEHGLAPTTSTVVQLALADALAAAISRARNFTQGDFFRNHPAGALGKRLMRVDALMRVGEQLPTVPVDSPLTDVLATISAKLVGSACVVDEAGRLVGLITDGDVRRALENRIDLYSHTALDIMKREPQTARLGDFVEDLVKSDDLLGRHFTVPVLDDDQMLCGILVSIDLI
jgi:arabinose-5-phosphate isomerase